MTRILIVDDHEAVRRGIHSIFATEPALTVCGEAADGVEALKKTRALHPDVIVMDISMPNMNGLEATRQIKEFYPQAQIVIVSQHETPEIMRQAFRDGASAYVKKSTISTDLLPAIARVSEPDSFSAEHPTGITNYPPVLQSKQRFHAVMGAMSEGLYTIDADGLLTYINPAAEAMFGWTTSLLGQNMHDAVHYKRPDGLPFLEAECPILRSLEKGVELREHDEIFVRKDGSFFPVTLNAAPLKCGDAIAGAVVCFRDNERHLELLVKNLEARIAERTQELESANEKLRDLSGRLLRTQDEERRRIARELHDGIGQLLAALSMNLTTLENEKPHLGPDAKRSLDESAGIIEQASKEIRTMSYLLHPPMLDEVGLESALRWYIDGFAERSKIAVDLRLDEGFSQGLPRDMALTLFRIVQECLTNIHRHSGSATAFVGIYRAADRISLKVEDRGKGIPPDVQSNISSSESFGVGLRGMRERIRQFDGHMEIRSNKDGACVTVELPAPVDRPVAVTSQAEASAGNAVVAAAGVESAPGTATILCIDDEAAGLLPRKLLLESAGHTVIEARSGLQGIELFRSHKIDAVILDYWMSGMKGTTVAAELKRINPAVPIIVLSGMADLPGEAAGLVDQWLVKGSHRPEQLLDSISSLLERRPA